MRLLPCLLSTVYCLLVAACGYQPVTYLQDISSVAVPILENRTLKRGYEFELTHKIKKEISERTPLKVVGNPKQADLVIRGEIIDYVKPALVENPQDQVIESQVGITLKVIIQDTKAGKIIYEGQLTQTAEFVNSRAETEEKARRELYEKLSRWVVSLLEQPPDEVMPR